MSCRTQDSASSSFSFDYRALTFCGRPSHAVLLESDFTSRGPSTPSLSSVWASPLSLAATQGITFVFFSSGYLDVSVRRVSLIRSLRSLMTQFLLCAGFPHSDICGSLLPYSSPQRFAVRCVLLQHQVSRHPPYALIYLIFLCVFAYLMNSSLFNSSFVKSFTLFGKTLFCLSVIRFSKIL